MLEETRKLTNVFMGKISIQQTCENKRQHIKYFKTKQPTKTQTPVNTKNTTTVAKRR